MKDVYELYLKPWIKDVDAAPPSIATAYHNNELWRHDMHDNIIAQIYQACMDGAEKVGWSYAYYTPYMNAEKFGPFPTAEIAMEKCDIRLLELGYTLLTQGRLAKIGLLI